MKVKDITTYHQYLIKKMKMPRVSPKVNQSMNSSTRSNKANRSNQIRANGAQIAVIKNGGNSGSGGSNGRRNHSGQSTLPSSPNNSGYEKFVNDFVAAWDKVMKLDRFDLQ